MFAASRNRSGLSRRSQTGRASCFAGDSLETKVSSSSDSSEPASPPATFAPFSVRRNPTILLLPHFLVEAVEEPLALVAEALAEVSWQ